MSRKKIIKESFEDEIEEAQVVMRWSGKRIVIATFVVLIIIAGGIYGISALSNKQESVLGEKINDQPQIELPTDSSIEDIIDNARADLGGINAENIISSQPKLKKIIEDLTNLSTTSVSAKSLICEAICK